MERRSLFVAGSWTNPVGDQRSEVRSPYDGHLVGTIPCASMTGADAALSAARTSLGGEWGASSVAYRAAMIVAIAFQLRKRSSDPAELMTENIRSATNPSSTIVGTSIWPIRLNFAGDPLDQLSFAEK